MRCSSRASPSSPPSTPDPADDDHPAGGQPVRPSPATGAHHSHPMILAKSCGAALFISMIRDQQQMYEVLPGLLRQGAQYRQPHRQHRQAGLHPPATRSPASSRKRPASGAVAITDTDKILAFIGIGEEHHQPGTPITSAITLQAIAQQGAVCRRRQPAAAASPPVSARLCAGDPVAGDQGSDRHHPSSTAQEAAVSQDQPHPGEGIASLLSQQLLTGRLEQQQRLLVQSELKAGCRPRSIPLPVQHPPTPSAPSPGAGARAGAPAAAAPLPVLSQEPQAPGGLATLQEEQEHRQSYLEIELARFGDRLTVQTRSRPPSPASKLPSFTLQPLIENAIFARHLPLLEQGAHSPLRPRETAGQVTLHVEDNAGTWQENRPATASA